MLPLAEIAGVLERTGYAGPLVLEWEKPWHPQIPELDTALSAAATWLDTLS